MALTPEDVVNKRFQPTKFREGYDQDEVDDFLDEVVVELRRLNQENEELRQRLVASDGRISELQRSGSESAAPQPSFTQRSEPAALEPAPATVAAPVVASAPAPAAVGQGSSETDGTSNLLQLARRLHEEHVREGVEKRDTLIAEGHATAARLVTEAESGHRAQIEALDEEREQLERRVDELRTFEREYRQKLKGYIEGQLRELDAESNLVSSSSRSAGKFTNNRDSSGGGEYAPASAHQDSSQPHDGQQSSANYSDFAQN